LRKEMNRKLVNGFLKASGKNIVNQNGDTVLLNGWGLGNWLLCEGYMWLHNENEYFDRPRRIEKAIEELTDAEFSEYFWKEFRNRYITKEDIKLMADSGYNSIRIPFNSRILLEEKPGLHWIEEGFALLDSLIDWCEEYGLYVFLDMHGAPGGQTGSNIDDSVDNLPRLFMDKENWDKAIAIWEKLADRYKDRWIVGGYDLLNEPLRPGFTGIFDSGDLALGSNNLTLDFGYLVPKLVRFYEECIAGIRKYDTKHMLSIEGHYWSAATSIFHKHYDDNMVIHFHRYGCLPEIKSFKEYLDVSERLNQPLWLGETGENKLEWFSAMYPLSLDLGIGFNVWPWKKMECFNSPLSVKKPEAWEKIVKFKKSEIKPSCEEAKAILNEYLNNILAENCVKNDDVTKACLRQPGCIVRGTDFDLFPGKGFSYSGNFSGITDSDYRKDTGMCIKKGRKPNDPKIFFDCDWDSLTLDLSQDEFAVYSIYDVSEGDTVRIEFMVMEDSVVEISDDNAVLGTLNMKASPDAKMSESLILPQSEKVTVKIKLQKGRIQLDKVIFLKA